MTKEIRVIGVEGLPEITPGMDLTPMIIGTAKAQGTPIQTGDIVVITQKVVSKAEGALVDLSTVTPSHLAREWAREYARDPRLIEVALQQSRRISRMDRGVLVVETRHGFYCINAGVDASNVPGDGIVTLLPDDSDASAQRVRDAVLQSIGV